MRTSRAGIELIKKFEGLRLIAYQCSAGVWTIGYGSTRGVKKGMSITDSEASKRLIEDLAIAEQSVSSLIKITLKQNQFDALVCFVFNIGKTQFAESTLLKLVNEGKFKEASEQFARWNKERRNGELVPSAGLTRRRKAEAELFST